MQHKQHKYIWPSVLGILIVLGVLAGSVALYFMMESDSDGRIVLKTETSHPGGEQYLSLSCGDVIHGISFRKPIDPADHGDPERDFSRLATTYYHRRSPVGVVLQRFDWFGQVTPLKSSHNVYHSDARLPASLVALCHAPFGQASLPGTALVGAWSEPPLAVVGLNAGTLASYVRPFQHAHFYERRDKLAELSWPKPGQPPTFPLVQEALARGGAVSRIAGDERKSLASGDVAGFYHVLVIETCRGHPDNPTKALLTKEAMQIMLATTEERGILCYHTSNRKYDLAPLVANNAADLGLACRRGSDGASNGTDHFYSSEWVMVARQAAYLAELRAPVGFPGQAPGAAMVLTTPAATNQPRMTDNQVGAIRAYLR